jgi:hypothetical protein
MISVDLLLLAGVVSFAATRLLPRAGWVFRSPRLGLLAWYAVIAATVSSVAGAVVSLLVTWPGTRATVCAWSAWCVQAFRGGHGPVGRMVATVLAVGLAVAGLRAAGAGWRLWRTIAQRRREHAVMAEALGRESVELGATVAAYVVPGRRARVVITTAACQTLAPREVAAVLAHERAHARGRHHLLADAVRLLAAAFPTVAVFAQARAQIDRLVEIRADEVASQRHSRLDLARALVSMAEAGDRHRGAVPAGAVAATGGDALERVQRLLNPPAVLPAVTRMGLGLGLVGLALTPLGLVVLTGVFPMLASCPSLA